MICDALIFKYLEFSHGLTICYVAFAHRIGWYRTP